MQKVTEAYAKQIVDSWDDYCPIQWNGKARASTGNLDTLMIAGAFGVSRSTAYVIKSRAEFLKKRAKEGAANLNGVGPTMESQDQIGVGTKSV